MQSGFMRSATKLQRSRNSDSLACESEVEFSPWCLRPVQSQEWCDVAMKLWQARFYSYFSGFPHCPKPFGRLNYCVTKPFLSLFSSREDDFNIPLWALANSCSANYRSYGGEEGWLGGNGEAYCPWMNLRSPRLNRDNIARSSKNNSYSKMSSSVNILVAQLCFDSSCPDITPQISLALKNAKYLALRLRKDLNPTLY